MEAGVEAIAADLVDCGAYAHTIEEVFGELLVAHHVPDAITGQNNLDTLKHAQRSSLTRNIKQSRCTVQYSTVL